MIERQVAIKTVRKELMDQDLAGEIIARFKNEAQAAGRLTHPGIVAIYEYGEDESTAYIAMEFVQGRGLRDYLARHERFGLQEVMSIMGQLLEALHYAHEHGVVHRDIKPANLIMTATGGLKVADFGIARIDRSNLTTVGSVMGTPSYMSPEQYGGLPGTGGPTSFPPASFSTSCSRGASRSMAQPKPSPTGSATSRTAIHRKSIPRRYPRYSTRSWPKRSPRNPMSAIPPPGNSPTAARRLRKARWRGGGRDDDPA
jgi:serine/threonine protein kinase